MNDAYSAHNGYYVFISTVPSLRKLVVSYSSATALPAVIYSVYSHGESQILYYRIFRNHLDALGFKLLLQNVSKDILWCLIKGTNPSKSNLYGEMTSLVCGSSYRQSKE